MKYRIKFGIYSLVAGLIVLINSCQEKNSSVKLVASKTLNFPSASAIEFYNNRFYLLGDDAPYLLILDTGYKFIDTVQYIQTSEIRLPKSTKPDVESVFIQQVNGQAMLFGIGSMSTADRFTNFQFNADKQTFIGTNAFFSHHTRFTGIEEINIEGAAVVASNIVLANRANNDTRKNHLIIFKEGTKHNISELILKDEGRIVGVSGLCYLKEKDILVFTASIENTSDATIDGAIGDSYVGWINAFSKNMNEKMVRPTEMINLSKKYAEFKGQKIESVCIESRNENQLLLHLVADNDNGKSKIFKINLSLR